MYAFFGFAIRTVLSAAFIGRIGTGQKNYEDLAQEIEMYTGGMSVSPHIVNHHSELDRFELVSGALGFIFYASFALHVLLIAFFVACKYFNVNNLSH